MSILQLYLEKIAEQELEEEMLREIMLEKIAQGRIRAALGRIGRFFGGDPVARAERQLATLAEERARALGRLGRIEEVGRGYAELAPEATFREQLRSAIRRHPILSAAVGIPALGLGIAGAGRGIGALIESARGRQPEYPFDIYGDLY